MAYHFRNLVFEGIGLKVLAYVGALKGLEKRGVLQNIERVAGTSTGAINAVLVGLGYSSDQQTNIMNRLDFEKFINDDSGFFNTNRLLIEFGWHRGDYFRTWIANLIKKKTGNQNATFAQVHEQKKAKGFRDIYIAGANLSTKFIEVFSHMHTPRMCVADAARISMSIPFLFASPRSPRGDIYVDGGVLNYLPIKIFDRQHYLDSVNQNSHGLETQYYNKLNQQLIRKGVWESPHIYNKETLGFRLFSEQELDIFRDQSEPVHEKIEDFATYTWNVIESILEAQFKQHMHSDDWQRTIYIETLGVRTTDFKITNARKKALLESGRKGTESYFKWFDNPKSYPVNRV